MPLRQQLAPLQHHAMQKVTTAQLPKTAGPFLWPPKRPLTHNIITPRTTGRQLEALEDDLLSVQTNVDVTDVDALIRQYDLDLEEIL